ncbi:MAG TPA: thioredoxin domain-containing protein [Thermoanaerobaculia bacterium]|nr:thioredoxin domain-containing protein [Thermoanaerobaculia bacterium]
MKRLLLAAALILALPLSAQRRPSVDNVALRSYVTKAMTRCPAPVLTLDPINQTGPANFLVYEANLRSSDENCNSRKYVLYSPTTQQVLIGTIFPLPNDPRPANVRIAEQTTEMMKTPMQATVSPFPLPDGMKAVTISKNTNYGPFVYHAFLDASERFVMVGSRGNLRVDPGKTLLEGLGVVGGVRRGNKTGKVQIVELSDFQCPTCSRAHKKIEPLIAKNLSKINYTRIDLPLFEHHEWAVAATLGGRAIQKVAPDKYWTYVDYVFANQEEIGKMPSFDKFLQNWVEDHDIDWKKVATIYNLPSERAAVLDQVSRAFDNGINSTPTYIVNGQVMGFGPDGSFTYEAIKKAIEAAK